MNTNLYYTDQELRTQRTNLEAMGYHFDRGYSASLTEGDRLVAEITIELEYRESLPPHPSNQAFGPDDIYDQDA